MGQNDFAPLRPSSKRATKLALALLGGPMACLAMFALRLRSLDGSSPHTDVGPHTTFGRYTRGADSSRVATHLRSGVTQVVIRTHK